MRYHLQHVSVTRVRQMFAEGIAREIVKDRTPWPVGVYVFAVLDRYLCTFA